MMQRIRLLLQSCRCFDMNFLEFVALGVDLGATLASASLTSGLSEGIQWGKSGTLQQVAGSVPLLINSIGGFN